MNSIIIILVLLVLNLSTSISSFMKSFPNGLSMYFSESKKLENDGISLCEGIVSSILMPLLGGNKVSLIFSGKSLKISEIFYILF